MFQVSSIFGADVVRPGPVFQHEAKRLSVLVNDFYRSSNGDRWQLLREHEPNRSSGGKVTEHGVQEFLDRTGSSPENLALRALLEKHRNAST
jgi:hypothetical protein